MLYCTCKPAERNGCGSVDKLKSELSGYIPAPLGTQVSSSAAVILSDKSEII